MSSTSSQESAGSPSDLNELECEPSRSVKSTPSAEGCSPSTGQQSLAMTMCEPSQPNASPPTQRQGTLPLTLSAEDSRVRISALLEREPDWLASAAAYGSSTPELLARFDLDSLSWRTSQRCLVEGLETFSETWPRSGMMLNGTAYRLPPLVPLTKEIASGLLPTPEASNTKAIALRSGGRSPRNFLAPIPTPTVNGNYNRKGLSPASGDGLATWVAKFPTPTARDFRSPGRSRLERTGSKAGECLPQAVGGQLNPTWVEWLMGFPAEWTALDSSEMRSSRKSRKSSGGQS